MFAFDTRIAITALSASERRIEETSPFSSSAKSDKKIVGEKQKEEAVGPLHGYGGSCMSRAHNQPSHLSQTLIIPVLTATGLIGEVTDA